MTFPPNLFADLQAHDTATVCNVLELAGLRPKTAGYADARIKALYPDLPPMVGVAVTAAFRACEPTKGVPVYQSLVDQVAHFPSLPGPAVVVFQDLDEPPTAATFGEVMCTTYATFGAAGLVTTGWARDIAQVEKLRFPCFASGVCSAHGYCHQPHNNIPVRIGGMMVHPGDLLHGDVNGLTTIPWSVAPFVARACARYMEAEAFVLDYLKQVGPTIEGYAEAMKRMRAAIESLGQDLRDQVARGV